MGEQKSFLSKILSATWIGTLRKLFLVFALPLAFVLRAA